MDADRNVGAPEKGIIKWDWARSQTARHACKKKSRLAAVSGIGFK
jgi:hypothetical protein